MSKKAIAFAVGLAFVASISSPSFAAPDEHLVSAVKHTDQAEKSAYLGDPDGVVRHAEEALRQAKESEKATNNEHTKQGIEHLNAAITEGQKGDAEAARKHAVEALTHLKQAEK